MACWETTVGGRATTSNLDLCSQPHKGATNENGFRYIYGMKLKIDKAGRIVVPKQMRERLGFRPDSELEVVEQTGGMFIKRLDERQSMVKLDGLWVHHGVAEPHANWDNVIESVREERSVSLTRL